MLGEHLGQCKDAAARTESGGARTGGERIIEPVEMGGRERNVASPQGFERRIRFGPQTHSATNTPKLDDLRPPRTAPPAFPTAATARLCPAMPRAGHTYGRPNLPTSAGSDPLRGGADRARLAPTAGAPEMPATAAVSGDTTTPQRRGPRLWPMRSCKIALCRSSSGWRAGEPGQNLPPSP